MIEIHKTINHHNLHKTINHHNFKLILTQRKNLTSLWKKNPEGLKVFLCIVKN